MSGRIISLSSAPVGSYVVIIWSNNDALVLPVVGFALVETTTGHTHITPLVTDSAGHPFDSPGGPDLLNTDAEWKVFAPGENGLRWAERWQEESGRRIEHWDVSVWWPSKSPLFATADSTLWSDDFTPPDTQGIEP